MMGPVCPGALWEVGQGSRQGERCAQVVLGQSCSWSGWASWREGVEGLGEEGAGSGPPISGKGLEPLAPGGQGPGGLSSLSRAALGPWNDSGVFLVGDVGSG